MSFDDFESRCSGGSRGVSGASNEPPLEPKLFSWGIAGKIGQTAKIEPPSANLNPRSKAPGSALAMKKFYHRLIPPLVVLNHH